MNILSIQSHVVYGHVGNASAVFCMQRLGVEVWPIHTVQFSNHTGYGSWKGQVFNGSDISDLMDGIEERNILDQCNGVLSGYIGSPDIGTAILDAVVRIKKANPQALYCCDPVMGDIGRGIYVRDMIPEFMKSQALQCADILIPNQFELEVLTGISCTTRQNTLKAIGEIQKKGPQIVMVTSLLTEETPKGYLDILVSECDQHWFIRTPQLEQSPSTGTGDAIASLFFAHYLRSRSVTQAVEAATSSVFSLLKRSVEAGSNEILLIPAQEEIVKPTWTFSAEHFE